MQKRPGLVAVITFIVGWFIGLVVFGWWLTPIQYEGVGISNAQQENIVRITADWYSLNAANPASADVVKSALSWGGDAVACNLANAEPDPAAQARLQAVAQVVNGQGCGEGAIAPAGDDDGRSPLATLFLVVLLIILFGAIIIVWRRRNEAMQGTSEEVEPEPTFSPEAPPEIAGDEEIEATPIARFQTTYNYGFDAFDDSFSIENANEEFLGECGVSISESLGTDAPKNVTAFEVWLFDKNDIRTVTKVVMSDHAFFDEALKAKLAPKGEPVLARQGEVVVLETQSLIINAEIKELEYGTGTLPPQSFFERMTIEMSTWSKDGDFTPPDLQGRVDEILNY